MAPILPASSSATRSSARHRGERSSATEFYAQLVARTRIRRPFGKSRTAKIPGIPSGSGNRGREAPLTLSPVPTIPTNLRAAKQTSYLAIRPIAVPETGGPFSRSCRSNSSAYSSRVPRPAITCGVRDGECSRFNSVVCSFLLSSGVIVGRTGGSGRDVDHGEATDDRLVYPDWGRRYR